jgi:hypothetical protein
MAKLCQANWIKIYQSLFYLIGSVSWTTGHLVNTSSSTEPLYINYISKELSKIHVVQGNMINPRMINTV